MQLLAADPSAAPLLYLHGGPGGSGIEAVERGLEFFESFLGERDVIVFDQRGTGTSEPVLDCPEYDIDPFAAKGGSGDDAELGQLGTCRFELTSAGVQLGSYSTNHSAQDVERVRLELGVDSWHLLGVSYGTYLAQEIMRHHPEHIESVTLDSVLPPGGAFVTDRPVNAVASLDRAFGECAGSSACAEAFPDIKQRYLALLDRFDAEPVSLSMPSGEVRVDGQVLLRVMFQLSYDAEAIAVMPAFIELIESGDTATLSSLLATAYMDTGPFALGMHWSVVCSDFAAFATDEAVAKADAAVDTRWAQLLSGSWAKRVCDLWQVPAAAPEVAQPVTDYSGPALLLSGAFDPVTPARWAARVADGLPAAQHLHVASMSHALFTSACGASAINAFVKAPNTNVLDACLDRTRKLEFFIPLEKRDGAGSAPGPGSIAQLMRGLPRRAAARLRWKLGLMSLGIGGAR